MEQPPGYVQPGKENLVCKLRKSLYGLKQAPRCWNEKLREYLKSLGFYESAADPCVFIRQREDLEAIAVYVDELIKCWARDREKDNQEAVHDHMKGTINCWSISRQRVREAEETTWSDVTTHRGGVL